MYDFKKLLEEAAARYQAMTPEQQADMWRQQREGYARGSFLAKAEVQVGGWRQGLRVLRRLLQ